MFSHLTSMPTEVFFLVASAVFALLCCCIGFSMNIESVYDTFANRATPVVFRVLGVLISVAFVVQVLRVGHLILS